MKTKIAVILITVLAFAIRLAMLFKAPLPLNWDEVSHGYNAYSVLLTGTDEWGRLPLANFRAYGDYPLPLYLYLTIPFVFFFGLTEAAIRMPSIVFGSLTVLGTYFLAKSITKDEKVALLGAIVLALSPWHIHQSRAVFQSVVAIFFVVWGVYLFTSARKNSLLATFGILVLFLSTFAYHNARIFVPLIFALLIFLYRKTVFEGKYKYLNIILSAVLFVSVAAVLLAPSARARSKWVGIINEGAIQKIEDSRAKASWSPVVERLVFNRATYFLKATSANYISYFSPDFLFLKGGTQYQFSVPETGIMYAVEGLFFYLGMLVIVGKAFKGDVNYKVLLSWLILSPIPAAITEGSSHVIRASTMIPIPHILVAVGLFSLVGKDKVKRAAGIIFVALVAISFVQWLQKYSGQYVTNYAWSWQYGYKEMVDYAKSNYDKYDRIVVTKKYGEPHEFVLFYWPWDPAKYKADPNLVRFYQSNWYWVDRFDKFYFVNDWQVVGTDNRKFVLESGTKVDCSKDKCLLITSPGNVPDGWNKLKVIDYPDKSTAFEIYEN